MRTACLILILATFFSVAPQAWGATDSGLSEARTKIEAGSFEEGKALLAKAAKANKKTAQNSEYLYLTALLELGEGNEKSALKHFEEAADKGSDEAALFLGKRAFMEYDFDGASDYLATYRRIREKAKKAPEESFEEYERRVEIAQNAFDRVEKVVIIDSISLPQEDFFLHYRLPRSAGKLNRGGIATNQAVPKDGAIFLNEENDYAIWSNLNKEGDMELFESIRLLSGEWMNMESLQGDIEKSGNYDYPFMSGDGQTLYFANDGEESMGGYDIFIAQKDPLTGEYRQPLNIGMPFNSPYNDFMMAIDEENGVGWWATDRNSPEGYVTVYVYLLKEFRENYPAGTENLESLAKITDYKSTQNESEKSKYREILNSLPSDTSAGKGKLHK